MSKYRIKIVEKNSGEKGYIPQYYDAPKMVGWENILIDIWNPGEEISVGRIETSISCEYVYNEEKKAELAIEKHKKHVLLEYNNKIKSIKYKDYE